MLLSRLRPSTCHLTFGRSFYTAKPLRPMSLPPFDTSPSFKLAENPNTSWKLGDGLASDKPGNELARKWMSDEELGWTTLKIDEMEKPHIYKFLTSAVTPRPVAFVSTLSKEGDPNLAPFSYFSMVSHDPPLVSVAFTLSTRKPKDSRENIKDTKEFVVNIISEPFVEAANACSVEAPPDVDEWIVSGLTPEPSIFVKPPRVRESAVSLECELFHFHDIAPPGSDLVTNTLVLGHIRVIHVRNSVLSSSSTANGSAPLEVDPAKLRAISRLGGIKFARVGEGFEIPRPSWREVEGEVEDLIKRKKKEN